jgi:hypothetical protein
MKAGIVVAKAKRGGVGGASRFRDQPRLETRPRRGHPRRLPRGGRMIGREDNLDLGIARDRPGRSRKRASEEVYLLGHRRLS